MMKQFLTFTIVIILAMAFTAPMVAQEGRGTGRMIGYVKDSKGNVIEGANVTLEYMLYAMKKDTVTDAEGKFSFGGLGAGEVRIKAEKRGFANAGIQTRVSGLRRNPVQYITMQTPEEADPTAAKNRKSKNDFTNALALFDEGKFDDALQLFIKFREAQPKMYKTGINIANTLVELKRYDEAIKEYQIVMDKMKAEKKDEKGNQDYAKIYAGIGDIYMRQNKFKEAEEYFKKSIEIDKSDHALAYNVGEILFVAGKADEAIKYYKIAIQIKPDWPKAYKQAGYALLNKGDTKAAIEMLKKYVQLDPNAPDASGVEEVIKSLQ